MNNEICEWFDGEKCIAIIRCDVCEAVKDSLAPVTNNTTTDINDKVNKMESNKYQLEDYFAAFSTLKERYGDKYEVDIATNKIGQPSVRLQYKLSKVRSYELFVFGFDFAVAYKPNGNVKMYKHLTPK